MRFKKYVCAKAKQIKHISWFLAGFAFGCNALFLAILSLVFAIVFDLLSYLVSPSEPKKAAGA